MGSLLYDYLNDSELFDERRAATAYQGVPEHELRRAVQLYREFCAAHFAELAAEVPVGNGANAFLPRLPSIDQLKRTALYVPCHLVADPLLALAHGDAHVATRPMLVTAGLNDNVDRQALARAVNFMRMVTPMVAADCLKFLPTPLLDEPDPHLELRSEESSFPAEVPEPVRSLLRQKAVVRSTFINDGVSYVTPTLEPCRQISIRFQDDAVENGFFYMLQQVRVLGIDKVQHLAHIESSLPEDPPAPAQFEAWVAQSVDASALLLIQTLLGELSVASEYGACLNLRSPLAMELLKLLGRSQERPSSSSFDGNEIRAATVSALPELDLPLLDSVGIDDLMRIRLNEGEAFEALRRALEVGFRELRLEADPDRRATRTENLFHELTEVQVAACKAQVGALRKTGLLEVSVAGLALTGAVLSSGWSLLIALMAALNGWRTYDTYYSKVKATPGYFLWRLKQAGGG